MTNAFTKNLEVLFDQWFCSHGTPVMYLSDQGKDLHNQIVDNLGKLMGIQKSRTTPHHQSGGSSKKNMWQSTLVIFYTVTLWNGNNCFQQWPLPTLPSFTELQ